MQGVTSTQIATVFTNKTGKITFVSFSFCFLNHGKFFTQRHIHKTY